MWAACNAWLERSDRVSTKRLVPIKDKVFLKEEGYYTPPAVPSSPEPILVPGPFMLPDVSKEEAERQVQEVSGPLLPYNLN